MKQRMLPIVAATFVMSFVGFSAPSPAADIAAGKRFFKKCVACHVVAPNEHKVGPSLSGLFGRRAATAAGYKRYSESLLSAGARGLVWNEDMFLQYIRIPNQFLRDYLGDPTARSNMTFAGVRKQNDRENILAYLLETTM